MRKLSENELLRQACIYAEQDRRSLVQAYDGMENDPVAREAASFVKQIRAYRLKRWGKTQLEVMVDEMVEKPIGEFIKES